MNINKWISMGLVILPSSTIGGILIVAATATISVINNPILINDDSPYNDLVENFSISNDGTDKYALDYYQKTTYSIAYSLDRFSPNSTWHLGTTWFFGYDNINNKTYFATNIHVIDKLLVYKSALTSVEYAKRFSFRSNPVHFKQYNNTEKNYSYWPVFDNIKLEKLCVKETDTILPNDKPLYSDLAIFSTSTRFPNVAQLDFIDTDDEINYVTNNLKNLSFYLSGFPVSDKYPIWVTAKYKWINGTMYDQVHKKPKTTTSWNAIGYQRYLDSDGLIVDATGLSDEAKKHYSYARQITFPGLNIHGGSSGSLVTVFNENTGKLQPLGIYWGVYKSYSQSTDRTFYEGGIDLFYSGKFQLSEQYPNSDYSYNNLTLG